MAPVDRRHAKDELFGGFAAVGRALGNGHRAEIVDVLSQGERSVEVLAGEIGQSVANTSHHLQVLAQAGLVRSRRAGKRVLYSLSSDRVDDLWAAMREVAATHVEAVAPAAAAYLGDRADIETITPDELDQRLVTGRVVLLDVRPSAEYEAGHIPGARSTPMEDLDAVLESLPRRGEVVAYCRGPYCAYADEAVRRLRQLGRRARRLDAGLPEWRRSGRPVEARAAEIA